ncbi:hypothetical protein C8P63_11742 [Melghirimyces profundicolus]|uniref:Uncharacterized protein n=1 Tax=Melghirimyces profundicolus TaxID=1242148 RepID=A0A2T6BQD2_9BACL|nr:hypothetical protein [Melghirimyces profundicolus]PTX58295.1 hypothetical protein C8P63_11742 [Melghirimyces profundicolus]
MSDTLENRFVKRLRAAGFGDTELRTFAGTHFLYLCPRNGETAAATRLSRAIRKAARPLLLHTKLTLECHFVRKAKDRWVYRIRFRVPDEKSFCCGNQCPDCVLLRSRRS